MCAEDGEEEEEEEVMFFNYNDTNNDELRVDTLCLMQIRCSLRLQQWL